MTEGNETVSEFALTSGELYLASGAVEKKDMRRPENYAGPTRGGVKVKYTARVSEIFDEDGNVAATLRYGERTCVSGTLARISPRLLSVLIGSDAENIVPSADGLSENVRIEIRSAFFSYVRSTAARSFSFISARARRARRSWSSERAARTGYRSP